VTTPLDPTAPPVVAVVVTGDPGPWFEEALVALGQQDYPNLSVLVIDVGSVEDPTSRVAAVLPGAYVRRTESPGYSAAANEVLGVVEGASHFLFCHDDVAPDDDAVRLLLEEAFRSNAGVTSPKLVAWDEPGRLLAVGVTVDKAGHRAGLVEAGELDQEQHDAVRDVFAAPGACMLVRADLFASLGGFDPQITLLGEDIDFCWRAQVAGARVVVAPAARVRHVEASTEGRRPVPLAEGVPGGLSGLEDRHRVRTMLKCYGRWHLFRVAPQAALLTAVATIYSLMLGRVGDARGEVSAWIWNLRRIGSVRGARRQVQRTRTVPDRDIRRLQIGGSARARAFVEARVGGDAPVASVGREWSTMRQTDLRLPTIVWSLLALVFLVGSRHLIADRLPGVGQLAPFPDGPTGFLRPFLSGWRWIGLGTRSSPPAAFGLLGLSGGLFLGGMGLLQKVVVLGPIPFGIVGAWRLARPLDNRRARLVATVVYATVPLPYNALAHGRWSALLVYGAFPWLLSRLLAVTGLEPFGRDRERAWLDVCVLILSLALVGAFAPLALPLLVVVAIAIAAASLLVGDSPAPRVVSASLVAVAGAFVLLLPWSATIVGSPGNGLLGVAPPSSAALGFGAFVRFHTGPLGGAPLGWAFVVAALLPLLIGREWRLSWAVRCWTVALTCWGLAWAGGRGWLPTGTTSPEILLVPAATALALAAALGLVAFELDLPGYRFGWRQAASLAAAIAVLAGTTPVLLGTTDGRWHLPATDLADGISWMPAQQAKGDFRVLWLGDPRTLPLDGWRYRQGVAYGTSFNGPPDATDLWPPPSPGVAHRLADDIGLAEQGRTTEVGHLLAPKAVRYVVLPSRPAATGDNLPPPGSILRGLAAQNDLRAIDAVTGMTVYENVAWAPVPNLRHHPADSGLRLVLVVAELVLWVALVFVIRRLRRRTRAS
jgi:GT2 family glycosyltransferase